MKKVDEMLDRVSNEVKNVISNTFAEKEKGFKTMFAQADMDSSEQERLIKKRQEAIANLDNIVKEAKSLKSNY